MKSAKIVVPGFLTIGLAVLAFNFQQTSSIKGHIMPADKAVKVVAVPSDERSIKDSIAAPITNGNFEIQNLKAGDYSVLVQAQAPYESVLKAGVTVEKGKATDLGEIQLQQK